MRLLKPGWFTPQKMSAVMVMMVSIPLLSAPANASTTICIEGSAKVCKDEYGCVTYETPGGGMCFELGGGGNTSGANKGNTGNTGGSGGSGNGSGGGNSGGTTCSGKDCEKSKGKKSKS